MANLDRSLWPGLAPPQAHPLIFKEALARLASGLAIISFWDHGLPRGLLVSSITGLSIEPPRFLFCVQKSSACHDALLQSKTCGVTILSAENQTDAQAFIDPELRSKRFTGQSWRLAEPAPPLLSGGLSASACSITSSVDGGSHTILIVTAETVTVNDGDPLLSYNRRLVGLAAATASRLGPSSRELRQAHLTPYTID